MSRLTVNAAARSLGLNRNTVRIWVHQRRIKAERSGDRGWWQIPASEVDRVRRESCIVGVGSQLPTREFRRMLSRDAPP